MSQQTNNTVVTATKWSLVTEIAAKLVSPVSTMVLARLLTPEAFGVLVTVTMVISFAEIFTDAGFQKYIIQHKFKDESDLYQSTTVAFWSNFIFSLALWMGIALFSNQIAYLVGNDGYGLVIAIASICIPIESFSSIQMALFKRKMDFKTLFFIRIVGIMVPLVVTIPLAFLTHSYWSLVVGMMALNLINAILLTAKSSWKPRWFYSIRLFKEMFSFTVWSMLESVSIWLTGYIDVLIVGTTLSTYYMGIYRTSTATVGSIMSIITSSTTPVLFSALSRLQDNEAEFKQLFFKFQKLVGLLILPFGVGIYLFRDLITDILLGSQWKEASYFIGWWGLTSALTIVFSYYCSEVFRAKAKPKLSVLAQILHLLFLVPTVLFTVHYGFDTLCLSRSLVRLSLIAINLVLLYQLTKITPLKMFINIFHPVLASLAMFVLIVLLPSSENVYTSIAYLLICIAVYIVIVCMFVDERKVLCSLKRSILHR